MKKLAIFDLDGTLLDSAVDIAKSCNAALEAFGLPTHPLERVKTFIGNGARALCHRALPEELRDTPREEEVLARFLVEYERSSQQGGTAFPGMKELLEQLRAQGVHIAVNTNKPEKMTQNLVAACFGGLAELVYGQADSRPTKPDPTVCLEIMEKLGATPEETVYIGDSVVDLETGRNAGVQVICVTWGYCPLEKLKAAGPDALVSTAQDVYNEICK